MYIFLIHFVNIETLLIIPFYMLLLQLLMCLYLLMRSVLGRQPLPVAAEMTIHRSGLMIVCV